MCFSCRWPSDLQVFLSLRTQRDMNNRLSWPVTRLCLKAPGLPKIDSTSYSYASRTRRGNIGSQKGHAFLYFVASFAWEQQKLSFRVGLSSLSSNGAPRGCFVVCCQNLLKRIYRLNTCTEAIRDEWVQFESKCHNATTQHRSTYAKNYFAVHYFQRCLVNDKQSFSTPAPASDAVCPDWTASCVGSTALSKLMRYFFLCCESLICTRGMDRPFIKNQNWAVDRLL